MTIMSNNIINPLFTLFYISRIREDSLIKSIIHFNLLQNTGTSLDTCHLIYDPTSANYSSYKELACKHFQ